MKGQRADAAADGHELLRPGDYGKDRQGNWLCCPPTGCRHGGNLRKHTVVEHPDGTITVSPSILIHPHGSESAPCPGWHGYLECGIWRTA